ncbi:hypothetical protein BB561_001393 [Smittium simulii]|uniref:Uncharacterized protein n=1 Tax=Smittium simulii TaxID=133385 RepID=A0A2T9YUX4_9FUNG|nr:hypothetical protein BB561_001393 [Smittium simulii]
MGNLTPLIGVNLPKSMLSLFLDNKDHVSLTLNAKEKTGSGNFKITDEILPVKFRRDLSNKSRIYCRSSDTNATLQPAKNSKEGTLWNKSGHLKGYLTIPKSTLERTLIIKRKIEQKNKKVPKKNKTNHALNSYADNVTNFDYTNRKPYNKPKELSDVSSDIDMEPDLIALAEDLDAVSSSIDIDLNQKSNKHAIPQINFLQKISNNKGQQSQSNNPEPLKSTDKNNNIPLKQTKFGFDSNIPKSCSANDLMHKQNQSAAISKNEERNINFSPDLSNTFQTTNRITNNSDSMKKISKSVIKNNPLDIDLKKCNSFTEKVASVNNPNPININNKPFGDNRTFDKINSTQIPKSKPKTLGRHVKVLKTAIKPQPPAKSPTANINTVLQKHQNSVSTTHDLSNKDTSTVDKVYQSYPSPVSKFSKSPVLLKNNNPQIPTITQINSSINDQLQIESHKNAQQDVKMSISPKKSIEKAPDSQSHRNVQQDIKMSISPKKTSDFQSYIGTTAKLNSNSDSINLPKKGNSIGYKSSNKEPEVSQLVNTMQNNTEVLHKEPKNSNYINNLNNKKSYNDSGSEEGGEILDCSITSSPVSDDIIKDTNKIDIRNDLYKADVLLSKFQRKNLDQNNLPKGENIRANGSHNIISSGYKKNITNPKYSYNDDYTSNTFNTFQINESSIDNKNDAQLPKNNNGNFDEKVNSSKGAGQKKSTSDPKRKVGNDRNLNIITPKENLSIKPTLQSSKYSPLSRVSSNQQFQNKNLFHQKDSHTRSTRQLDFENNSSTKDNIPNHHDQRNNKISEFSQAYIELVDIGAFTSSIKSLSGKTSDLTNSFVLSLIKESQDTVTGDSDYNKEIELHALKLDYKDQIEYFENLNLEYDRLYSMLENIQKDRFSALDFFVSEWNQAYEQFQNQIIGISTLDEGKFNDSILDNKKHSFFQKPNHINAEDLVQVKRNGYNVYIAKNPNGFTYLCGSKEFLEEDKSSTLPPKSDTLVTKTRNSSANYNRIAHSQKSLNFEGTNDECANMPVYKNSSTLSLQPNNSSFKARKNIVQVGLPIIYRELLSAEVKLWELYCNFVETCKRLWSNQVRSDIKKLTGIHMEILAINKELSK